MYFQVEMLKNARKDIFRAKQTTNKVPLMSKWLLKGKNCIIKLCQEKNKVQCVYLAFENLKMRSKKGQQWSES